MSVSLSLRLCVRCLVYVVCMHEQSFSFFSALVLKSSFRRANTFYFTFSSSHSIVAVAAVYLFVVVAVVSFFVLPCVSFILHRFPFEFSLLLFRRQSPSFASFRM